MNTIAGKSVISIFLGEWPMWILVALSIFAITLIIERMLYFRRNGFDAQKGFVRFRELMAAGNTDELKRYVQSQKQSDGPVVLDAIEQPAPDRGRTRTWLTVQFSMRSCCSNGSWVGSGRWRMLQPWSVCWARSGG